MSETSDFDFCDLLDEFFHMTEKHFFQKEIKLSKVILKSHIYIIWNLVSQKEVKDENRL